MEGAGTGRLVWAPVPFMEGGSTVGLAVVVDIHYKAETSHDRRQQSSRNGVDAKLGLHSPVGLLKRVERGCSSRERGGGRANTRQSLGRVRREYVHALHALHALHARLLLQVQGKAGEGGEGEQYEEEK